MCKCVLVDSHFLEAYPEHDVLAVRVPEAEPVAAVALLPRGQLLAVLVLAAPPAHITLELSTADGLNPRTLIGYLYLHFFSLLFCPSHIISVLNFDVISMVLAAPAIMP